MQPPAVKPVEFVFIFRLRQIIRIHYLSRPNDIRPGFLTGSTENFRQFPEKWETNETGKGSQNY
jgi:hypothetical protein